MPEDINNNNKIKKCKEEAEDNFFQAQNFFQQYSITKDINKIDPQIKPNFIWLFKAARLNYEPAIHELIKLADSETGVCSYAFFLGKMYCEGEGVVKDYKLAFKYLTKAYDAHHRNNSGRNLQAEITTSTMFYSPAKYLKLPLKLLEIAKQKNLAFNYIKAVYTSNYLKRRFEGTDESKQSTNDNSQNYNLVKTNCENNYRDRHALAFYLAKTIIKGKFEAEQNPVELLFNFATHTTNSVLHKESINILEEIKSSKKYNYNIEIVLAVIYTFSKFTNFNRVQEYLENGIRKHILLRQQIYLVCVFNKVYFNCNFSVQFFQNFMDMIENYPDLRGEVNFDQFYLYFLQHENLELKKFIVQFFELRSKFREYHSHDDLFKLFESTCHLFKPAYKLAKVVSGLIESHNEKILIWLKKNFNLVETMLSDRSILKKLGKNENWKKFIVENRRNLKSLNSYTAYFFGPKNYEEIIKGYKIRAKKEYTELKKNLKDAIRDAQKKGHTMSTLNEIRLKIEYTESKDQLEELSNQLYDYDPHFFTDVSVYISINSN